MKYKKEWKTIACSFRDLNLNIILSAGQSFRWHKRDNEEWQGVLSGHVWSLKQDNSGNLMYLVHSSTSGNNYVKKLKNTNSYPEKLNRSTRRTCNIKTFNGKKIASHVLQNCTEDFEAILKDYFQLHLNLKDFYAQWSSADSHFGNIAAHFLGVRILRQDPTENLISFICSSNNNIPRISGMVEKLCTKYGSEILQMDGQTFYSFPKLERLAEQNVEQELRSLGFGYRAKFINQAALHIVEKHPSGWLESLRQISYSEAHSSLTELPGVGAKVADCVCLMSLDKPNAIPVDTHVWQITVRDYLPHLKTTKSLTDKVYRQVGDFYREKFGEYAGWANSVLFAADLRQFKHLNKGRNSNVDIVKL